MRKEIEESQPAMAIFEALQNPETVSDKCIEQAQSALITIKVSRRSERIKMDSVRKLAAKRTVRKILIDIAQWLKILEESLEDDEEKLQKKPRIELTIEPYFLVLINEDNQPQAETSENVLTR